MGNGLCGLGQKTRKLSLVAPNDPHQRGAVCVMHCGDAGGCTKRAKNRGVLLWQSVCEGLVSVVGDQRPLQKDADWCWRGARPLKEGQYNWQHYTSHGIMGEISAMFCAVWFGDGCW